ncbi:hypothetical protein [Microbacterium pygmaeum]|uniref:Uncharacterized protein n=1 Tax=Microbacterium pygmaeum TaxID=370764 RepID=A0A1G8DWX4_9MICO|nr:hypothetical protein [Microbacterium pygmaeum]SDH61960.1 hypothetical protein SAMN04489810_3467 [Microbacterium pygmaeum]
MSRPDAAGGASGRDAGQSNARGRDAGQSNAGGRDADQSNAGGRGAGQSNAGGRAAGQSNARGRDAGERGTDKRNGAPARAASDRLSPATRVVAAVILPFLLIAAVLLYGFPTRTGELFAWPIDPPLTAYMLASAYVGGIWFFIRVVGPTRWHRVAPGFPAVVVFAGALLVATLLHLDKFSQNLSFAAWMTLYATTPFVVAALWWAQRRQDDGRPEASDLLLPTPVRTAMLAVGAASLITGAVMFVAPQLVIPVWAWTLTPLTAQVMGAVLSLPGVVAFGMLRDARWSSFRILFQAQLVSLVAIVASLIAGREALLWDRILTPAFLALIAIAFLAYAAVLLTMESRSRSHEKDPQRRMSGRMQE